MAAASAVRVYDTLKLHFGEADARQFIEYLETLTHESRGELATKADLIELRAAGKADLVEFRAATKADLVELRADLEKQISGLRAEMKTAIAESKADMVKWMFLFWLGQVAALFGLFKFLAPSL